ncbi:MAG: hypothetical protein HYW33_00970 [Candidatus Blackburnbacteria bacterium]|nr:hypothetical protein [Candidatus Blackburnbacteria bacterium]
MHHVAIMRKSWGLTEKILSGEKVIESRWYSFKRCPWNQVKSGDTVYFKNSGELVKLKASVEKVLQLENLTPEKVSKILGKYGKLCGIPAVEIPTYFQKFKDKKYCILIYLACVKEVDPFDIDKTGFGAMAAWLSVPNVDTLFTA